MKSYLGPMGYTVRKAEVTPAELQRVRQELTIQPVSGMDYGAPPPAYPVYRESTTKLYVPHHYGVRRWGEPQRSTVPEGDPIALTFHGQLRDYQAPVVQLVLDHCRARPCTGGILELPCAWGKTGAGLYIAAALQKKTLVIAHKDFLMKQWMERIAQFLPGARVGRIQGPIIDVEDKDIVLCMLQSLSMKDYPPDLFSSFGLTIVDEVHHISSEVFSNALFKIKTKYMLGLTATLKRKDGTTPVIEMFLGDVLYRGKRAEQMDVLVLGVQYRSKDPAFNEVLTDFRGNVQYSSMITKLCEYHYRSEFILEVLQTLLQREGNPQIMILAHNRSLLTYLHDAIVHRQMATVGYYLGGMRDAQLKETESKQVVIATYAMASEGLDIKTLSTLIMATPKTDIEQSVGRILRDRHQLPIVVDIIDSHAQFQNQWKRRLQFYKREKYRVFKTNHTSFTLDTTAPHWTCVFDPHQSCVGKKRGYKHVDVEEDVDQEDEEPGGVCLLPL